MNTKKELTDTKLYAQYINNLQSTVMGETELPPISKEAEKILKTVGMLKSISIIHDYLDTFKYPLITGKNRDTWFVERIKRVQERYFLPIK